MYTALYRTYRPEVFGEVLGQEHIVKILKNQISTGTVSHAYLFCGTRGTGKTTTARILAKGVNCTSEGEKPCGNCDHCKAIKDGIFIDVIEIDAASNNGVDNIRELRESVKYPPALGQKKVYIIDEVHMLSAGAFNALLKTLEEPPENVMFILATTEPQKLPVTILSRCMRLDFKRVSENLLRAGMEKICKEMGIAVSEGALKLIAVNADGSVRDGLSILDQCLSAGSKAVSREDVLEFLGASGEEVFAEMTDFVMAHRVDAALLLLDQVLADGKDVRQFMRDWLAHYRSLLITKFIKDPEDILNMSCENVDRVRAQSDKLALAEINRAIIEISKMMADAKWSTQPRILLELCIVNMAGAANVGEPVQMPETETVKVKDKDKKKRIPDVKETVKAEPTPGGDYDAIWASLFTEEGLTGRFKMLEDRASLTGMNDEKFFIAAQTEFVKDIIDSEKQTLEALMEKRTGKKRGLHCTLNQEATNGERTKSAEEVAEELGNKFGLDIVIE